MSAPPSLPPTTPLTSAGSSDSTTAPTSQNQEIPRIERNRVRSRRAAEGYVGAPHLALLDPDGFVDTGDLVERRGDRFYFVGRRGGLIKVAPEEVEAVINRHPAVTMSLVRARKSPITGAIVVADVVVDPAAHYRDEVTLRAKILSLCRKALPAHKTPTMLRFVPALEVGANGKVVRHDG